MCHHTCEPTSVEYFLNDVEARYLEGSRIVRKRGEVHEGAAKRAEAAVKRDAARSDFDGAER